MSVAPTRTLSATNGVALHLASCFDGLYRSLGAHAGELSDSGNVVAVFEMARSFGDVRDDLAGVVGRSGAAAVSNGARSVIEMTIDHSVVDDASGALSLYVVAMIVGPRLLISLRDASESAALSSEGPLRQRAQSAAGVLIGEMRRVGEVAARSRQREDASWTASARRLEQLVSQAGYGESFGLGVAG